MLVVVMLDPGKVNVEFSNVLMGAGIEIKSQLYSTTECWVVVDEIYRDQVLALQESYQSEHPANEPRYPDGITGAMVQIATAVVQASRAVPEEERTDFDIAIAVLDSGVRIP